MSIKNTLKQLLKDSIAKFTTISIEDIKIKESNNSEEVSYYSNILSIIKENLNEEYEKLYYLLKNNISKNNLINNINLQPNNLIKISINKQYLVDYIKKIIEQNDNIGNNSIGNNKKIKIEVITNNSYNLINNYLNTLLYIDNLSRIMQYCKFDIEKEIFFIEDKTDYDIIKKQLDNYRIYIEKYSNNIEITNDYIIEDLINKIRYTNKCYIEDNKLLIKNIDDHTKEQFPLINENGDYTSFSKILTNLYKIYKEGYKEIYIYSNLITNNCIDNIEEIFNSLNIDINLSKMNTILDNIQLDSISNINKIRYIIASNNNESNNQIIEKNLYKITSFNNKLDLIIKKITNNIDKYNNKNDNISYNIMNKLIEFEDIVIKAVKEKNSNIIIIYSLELIGLVNIIIDSKSFNNPNIINLFEATKIVNNNILKIIGLIPQDEI